MNQKRPSKDDEQGEKKPKTESEQPEIKPANKLPLKFQSICACQFSQICDECKNTRKLFLIMSGFGLAALGVFEKNSNKKFF